MLGFKLLLLDGILEKYPSILIVYYPFPSHMGQVQRVAATQQNDSREQLSKESLPLRLESAHISHRTEAYSFVASCLPSLLRPARSSPFARAHYESDICFGSFLSGCAGQLPKGNAELSASL